MFNCINKEPELLSLNDIADMVRKDTNWFISKDGTMLLCAKSELLALYDNEMKAVYIGYDLEELAADYLADSWSTPAWHHIGIDQIDYHIL